MWTIFCKLLTAADQALYRAKREGRNRACMAASERIGDHNPETRSDG